MNAVKGDIAYDNIQFGYGDSTIFKGLSFNIKAGETIAFVGPSGAGKTTLCSLLPRFYELDGGQITIDDIDIRDVTQQSLRAHIGIVAQDVFLFGGTIRENIAYGKLDANDDEIMDAPAPRRVGSLCAIAA